MLESLRLVEFVFSCFAGASLSSEADRSATCVALPLFEDLDLVSELPALPWSLGPRRSLTDLVDVALGVVKVLSIGDNCSVSVSMSRSESVSSRPGMNLSSVPRI